AGMRIEVVEPAVDHVLDQLALGVTVQLADVVLVHLVEDVDEEADHVVVLVLGPRGGAVRDGETKHCDRGDAKQPGEVPARHGRMILRQERYDGAAAKGRSEFTEELYRSGRR